MRSHLTRKVFRRLLAEQPLIHQSCLRKRGYTALAGRDISPSRQWRQQEIDRALCKARRSFFDLSMFRQPSDGERGPEMEPGFRKMMELEKLQRMRARLPPRQDITDAVTVFLREKRANQRQISDNEAKFLLPSLKYCLDALSDGTEAGKVLLDDPGVVQNLICALKKTTQKVIPAQLLELSRTVLEYVDSQREHNPDLPLRALARVHLDLLLKAKEPLEARSHLLRFESVLHGARSESNGLSQEADDFGVEATEEISSGNNPSAGSHWSRLLNVLATNGSESDFQETLHLMDQRGLEGKWSTSGMLLHSLRRGDATEVERCFGRYWHAAHGRARRIQDVLRWCRDRNEIDLGQRIVRQVLEKEPSKYIWQAVLVWAASTGKSVDEVGRMLDVMISRGMALSNGGSAKPLPDASTINALVEYANSKGDPYMAERFISLGRDRGIEPNGKTYTLQMEYRLAINDIDGALTAYKDLQAARLSSEEDVITVNKLVAALCNTKRHDFDTIMNVAADLSDRRAHFEPETVSALSILHLERDEIADLLDLLNTHAFRLSSTERTTVLNSIIDCCADLQTPVARAWEAYSIVREVFDEMSREPRTKLMTSFFGRERGDMAVYVFIHMRQHSRADTMPTIETYITAFLGAAEQSDLESLEVLHNQLKLDYNVEVNTRVRNALMLAYTECGKASRGLTFWNEIVASREGPNYNSLHIAFRACEKSPFGDEKAQGIWKRLRKTNVELDNSIWASYVAALAGNGDVAKAIRTLEEAQAKHEAEADVFMVGSMMNVLGSVEKQREVEDWAREAHPEVWEELVGKTGFKVNENDTKTFNIDRSLQP